MLTDTIERRVHGAFAVTISRTEDVAYARDCFEGTDAGWQELVEERKGNVYYIVSVGLDGAFMADIYVVRKLRAARTIMFDTLWGWRNKG